MSKPAFFPAGTYYIPAEPGLASTNSISAHCPAPCSPRSPVPSVPQGDRLILGCGFPGVSPNSLLFRLHVLGVPSPVQLFPIEWCLLHSHR